MWYIRHQISEKNILPWVGLEPTKQYIFRAEIEKNFVHFLVQMKTVEFAFELKSNLLDQNVIELENVDESSLCTT